MSLYVTVSGDLMVPDLKAFIHLVHALQEGGWMDEEHHFIYETDERLPDGPHVSIQRQSIVIPPFHTRNLSRVGFFEHPDTYGCLKFSTTDGMQAAWLEGPPSYCTPELPLWLFNESPAPSREDFGYGEGREEEYLDEVADWANDAEAEFHAAAAAEILEEAQHWLGHSGARVENVDRLTLHQQKIALYKLTLASDFDPTARDLVDGILNMCDALVFDNTPPENAPN